MLRLKNFLSSKSINRLKMPLFKNTEVVQKKHTENIRAQTKRFLQILHAPTEKYMGEQRG